MSTSVELRAQLLIGNDLKTPDEVRKVLELFQRAPDTQPTHWAASSGLHDPYNADAILAAIENVGEEGIVPTLMRTRPPYRYLARWYADREAGILTSLQVETKGGLPSQTVPQFLDFIENLAGALAVEWGHVDMRIGGQPPGTFMKSSGSYDHVGYYSRVGPLALFPRVYFGPRLLGLAPTAQAVLERTGPPPQGLPNGTVRFDLVPQPWNANPATLKAAQASLHALLQPTGLFARPDARYELIPGAAWLPPTGQA
jgi:hypothetical protein